MWRFNKYLVVGGLFFTTLAQGEYPSPWVKFKHPIAGEPMAIGKYTNGCLVGGKQLAFEGDGYQVVRREKYRYFGHPAMVDYIHRLGKKIKQAKLPAMLISDIAMPAGGRFPTGHQSHQFGLDADIWFRMGKLSSDQAYSSTGLAPLMVEKGKMTLDWGENQLTLLRLAAQDYAVARIFVNPYIKIHLCETVTGDRSWLRKIRPWSGHNAHFHVRLHCPEGSEHCENQAPIPEGDGCNASLYDWVKPKPKPKDPKKPVKKDPVPPPPPPPLCQMLLDNPTPESLQP